MVGRVSKYRVDDDWIDREDDSDYVLRTAINVQNLFATLKELKTRRESDTSGGVTMERVSDDWLNNAIQKYLIIDRKSKNMYHLALCELRERRQNEIKAQQEIEKLKNEYFEKIDVVVKSFIEGHTDNSTTEKDGAGATQEKAVLPIPCTKGFEDWTVKRWFAKINEELDEMKNAVLVPVGLDWRPDSERFAGTGVREIAVEAADTITAITSMLEAMGIDEQARQAAQRRVNEHNRQRGRF